MPRPLRADTPAAVATVRLTAAERERAQLAARQNDQRFSEFVRDAIANAADDYDRARRGGAAPFRHTK